MGATITVGAEEITITLSGLNALSALRRSVHIPLAAITTIRSESAEDPDGGHPGRVGDLTGFRSATVRRGGRRVLLAHRPDRPTVTLDLDRDAYPEIGFDAVVLTAGQVAVGLSH